MGGTCVIPRLRAEKKLFVIGSQPPRDRGAPRASLDASAGDLRLAAVVANKDNGDRADWRASTPRMSKSHGAAHRQDPRVLEDAHSFALTNGEIVQGKMRNDRTEASPTGPAISRHRTRDIIVTKCFILRKVAPATRDSGRRLYRALEFACIFAGLSARCEAWFYSGDTYHCADSKRRPRQCARDERRVPNGEGKHHHSHRLAGQQGRHRQGKSLDPVERVQHRPRTGDCCDGGIQTFANSAPENEGVAIIPANGG